MGAKICCLILNYNNPKDSIEAALSLKKADLPKESAIIIIDNGTRNLKNFFVHAIPGVIYLKSPGNIGFAAGNNQGIIHALKNQFTHVLIMNPDVRVPPLFFAPLLATFREGSRTGLVAPAHQEPNSSVYGLGGKINWESASFPHDNVSVLPSKPRRYDLLTFACVLIAVDVFNRVGLMDERYFLYLEDVDYCVSANKKGYELYLNPQVVVTHKTSSSFRDPRAKIKFSFKSSLIFINKWYRFPHNLVPLLHTFTFYPYTYILWSLKLFRKKLTRIANKTV